uniref:Myb/SANT-like DNA-binding domain-containing protein n=1 Tax=Neogobius melanostomus TaxID=47308 RepID=A0A8C6SVU2_9GOBI
PPWEPGTQVNPWSISEVQTFICVVGDEKIQRELDGATRNERIFQELAERMAEFGYTRTSTQCREKLKKLKSDYKENKDYNSKSGADKKVWKWFHQMDAIYGHRPVNSGREGGHDSAATALLESLTEEEGECFRSIVETV